MARFVVVVARARSAGGLARFVVVRGRGGGGGSGVVVVVVAVDCRLYSSRRNLRRGSLGASFIWRRRIWRLLHLLPHGEGVARFEVPFLCRRIFLFLHGVGLMRCSGYFKILRCEDDSGGGGGGVASRESRSLRLI